MAQLVSIHELRTHEPELKDGHIVGCRGCQWQVNWVLARGKWEQYLSHLPAFQVDGYLPWTDEDIRTFQRMEQAFIGPVENFEE